MTHEVNWTTEEREAFESVEWVDAQPIEWDYPMPTDAEINDIITRLANNG